MSAGSWCVAAHAQGVTGSLVVFQHCGLMDVFQPFFGERPKDQVSCCYSWIRGSKCHQK